jgi:uncharacterized protein YdeI (YjbR/CyaY-like superfamily)
VSVANLPIVFFATQAEWAAWLEEHGEASGPVAIKIARKSSGIQSLTHALALDVALAHGWIDGQAKSLDDDVHYLQRFGPRNPRSLWSKRNRAKAEDLIARGEMKPAGLREVERAKADGRWDAAYDAPSTANVPDDLQAALDADDAARAFFATLKGQNRYAILHRIQTAKKPETRARRIAQFVEMLAEGRTLH